MRYLSSLAVLLLAPPPLGELPLPEEPDEPLPRPDVLLLSDELPELLLAEPLPGAVLEVDSALAELSELELPPLSLEAETDSELPSDLAEEEEAGAELFLA